MRRRNILIFLYVHDIIIAGLNLNGIQNLKKKLTESFDIKDLGEFNKYLGMKITWAYKNIKIDQSSYARDVVTRFKHSLSSNLDKTYTTPMDRDIKITKANHEEKTKEQARYSPRCSYQNYVSALLYLSINTRPDLSYSAGVLARHCINSSFRACQAVLRSLRFYAARRTLE